MRQAEPVIEESGSVEDVHHLRLMALLHELVREKGNRGAAFALGIDPRTVASCTKTGRLSWRVREALEQGLQSGASSAAARQRERNDALERRLEELEGKLRSGLEEVRAAVAGEVEALREEQAQGMRRLAQSETGQDARDGAKAALAAVEQPVVKPAWRLHRELVTQEPGPGEEQVYGDAMPVIVEWRRQARAEYAGAKNRLDKAVARRRVLELEIAIIECRSVRGSLCRLRQGLQARCPEPGWMTGGKRLRSSRSRGRRDGPERDQLHSVGVDGRSHR